MASELHSKMALVSVITMNSFRKNSNRLLSNNRTHTDNIFDGLHFALWLFSVRSLQFYRNRKTNRNKNSLKCIKPIAFSAQNWFIFCLLFYFVLVCMFFFVPSTSINSKALLLGLSYHMFLKCAERNVYF